ncbi:hypothetical protein AAHZ94_10175 [Streptomyces sp. HSW2009]|uniref:hypothetical protein n=1 Tax=Streptomyces sp. HSW2009 TaxID=3142890 RepID=UPI0032EB31C3
MAEEEQGGGGGESAARASDKADRSDRADRAPRDKPGDRDTRDRDRDKGGERRGEGKADDERRGEGKPDGEGGDGGGEDKESEHERLAGRFREHTRDPMADDEGDEGPSDFGAAARTRRATRLLFDTGRDLNSFDRSYIRSAHIGDIHLRMDARQSVPGMRSGPVPQEELRRLRRVHVVPDGYVRLRSALRARRLLVLGAAPGTGRTSTALSLLDEVTALAAADANEQEEQDERGECVARVLRVDPDGGVGRLADSLTGAPAAPAGDAGQQRWATGYLLALPLSLTQPGAQPPAVLDLDRLAAALATAGAYAVLVVTLGAAANPLLSSRYGMLCPPAPTQELLATRLRERIEDHVAAGDAVDGAPARTVAELLASAEELASREEVRAAVGLKDLRPAEAEVLASLLAEHLLEELPYAELLAGCRSLAAVQAQEWFAGVDRALTVRPDGDGEGAGYGAGGRDGRGGKRARSHTAALFHPVASRIALAALGGATQGAVSTAAHLLTWELSVQADPDHTPARTLFCDDPVSDLALSRAESTDGTVEVLGHEMAARLLWYRGSALPAAVLSEVWDQHFPVRAPVVRWLRLLADDPRPQVWVRAAVAAGELCVRDFDYGYEELIRPLAEAPTARRRIFAATLLDQVAAHASHRTMVRKVVGRWTRRGSAELRWTAAWALGYGNAAATTGDTLDALTRIGVRDDGDQLAVASFNVVRLLARPDGAAVLRRISEWTHHRSAAHQDLGLVTTVRMAGHDVAELLVDEPGTELGERSDWPMLLALADTRPELVDQMADLVWTALNTHRSKEVATNALEDLLRSAVRQESTQQSKPGLAVLLPVLTAAEDDRRQLDWLLRRMMNDSEDPLPEAQARELWWLATPRERAGGGAARGRREERENHG